jgi:N-acetylneuraminic acid mutarotase
MAALDGIVYVSGGAVLSRTRAYDTLHAYDPATDSWSERAAMPGARYAHAMAGIGGRLYVTAGITTRAGAAEEVWVYDPAGDAWSIAGARMPTTREHVAGVAHQGRFLVVGGRNGANLGSVESYDPVADRWERLPDMPTPKGALTVGVLDGSLHTTGGEDFTTNRTIGVHEALDLDAGTWRRLPDLPHARHGLASGVVDGRWIVAGGGPVPGGYTSDLVEVYAP